MLMLLIAIFSIIIGSVSVMAYTSFTNYVAHSHIPLELSITRPWAIVSDIIITLHNSTSSHTKNKHEPHFYLSLR